MFDFSFLPEGLREKMMPFQRLGVQYAIERHGRCLIGDEMGLGKTIQAIAVAYYYRAEWPLLVVLPSSMKYPWVEELERWLPCLQPNDINLITSSTDISNISKCAISLVGYGLMQGSYKTLREALHKQEFKVIILDESHFLKNPKAARTKTLLPLLTKAKRVLMLSGTPALARPAELYPQINSLAPGQFGSWTSFSKKFCDAKMKFFGRLRKWDTTGASNLPELHKKLTATVMIRREKKEVLTELPPKRRQKVPFELAESPKKKDLEKLWADLGLYLKGESPADSAGADAGFEIRRLATELYIATGKAKIGAVSEYIKMLLDNPEMKFLVFAHHKEVLTAVVQTVQAYAREKEPSLKYIRIDGDVPPIERMHDVNRFQRDPNVRVAALSIMAAGTGLTLTAASHVVFAELHWTPGVLEQCEDRAHRIGQLNAIHIHYLVARGTIDEWMWSALNRKVGVLSSTLNGRLQQLDAEVLQGGISDCLKQAAYWLPSDLDDEEDDSCLFTQTQKESRDIRSYMQSSQSKRKTLTLEDRFRDEPSPVISLVDSDDSELDDATSGNLSTVKGKELDPGGGGIDSFSDPESGPEVTISEITEKERAEESRNLTITSTLSRRDVEAVKPKFCSSHEMRVEPTSDETVGGFEASTGGPGIPPVCADSTSDEEALTSAAKVEQGSSLWSSRDLRMNGGNAKELHVSESSDSDCELIVGGRFPSQKEKRAQRSQQNLSTTVPSQGTPSSSSLDRRRNLVDSVCLTPDGNSKEGNMEQWNCPACTFLNHKSLPLCEICDTPRRRAEKQRRINTRSRVPEEQSSVKDNQALLETLSGSDDDFEILPRAVRLKPSAKKRARSSVDGRQQRETADISTPSGTRSRDNCAKTGSISRQMHDSLVSNGPSVEKQHLFGEHSGDVITERLSGTSGEADSLPDKDSTVRIQRGAKDQQEDSVPNNRSKILDSNHIHGIDISDSDSDSVDNFLKVDVLRTDSGVSVSTQSQKDGFRHTLNFDDVKSDFIESAATESKNSKTVPENCSPELSDALFSDGEDSERNDRPSESQVQKEVNGTVGCLLKSPHRSGSKVKPWTCAEPSCQFMNTFSSVECENCWAPNPDEAGVTTGSEGDAKVHNLGLRQSPGFISASRVLAEQGGQKFGRKVSPSAGPERNETVDTQEPPPEPKAYEGFLYCASKYTERIYLYDMDKRPLDCAFQPLDLRSRDMDNLPSVLRVPHNMRMARIFLREWDSLTEMKKRKLRKSGLIFDSPTAAVEALIKKRPFELSKQRFLTKDDLANAALRKAEEVGGSVRVIHRKKANQTLTSSPRAGGLQFVKSPVGGRKRKGISEDSTAGESSESQEPSKKMRHDDREDEDAAMTARSSFVQAVSADGVPLCVICNSPVEAGDLSNHNAAWDTKYCSEICKEEYKVRWKNSKYVREQLLETEHGICQLCQLDAHSIYKNIRDVPKTKRKEFLSKTAYSGLSSKHLNEMIKNPSEGQFWHADHIIPVYKGGGLCSLENFRTLCVLCHAKVTAEQNRERRKTRTMEANKKAGLRDIRKFFQDKG